MARPIDIDHPAVGAEHVFVPGNADSLVAAALLLSRSSSPGWVMLVREHRLPVLLEKPLAEVARAIWCLGYSGSGNPLLPAALEAHVTHRPLHWLSVTSGRLSMTASELPGVQFRNLPGGSLVHVVQPLLQTDDSTGTWNEEDRSYERLGFILGHYRGARPSDFELKLVNSLHAASVEVRNHEHFGAGLVRALADAPVGSWAQLDLLNELAERGDGLIKRSRAWLVDAEPRYGEPHGPAIWVVPSGHISRGAHGKALAARCYARQAPTVLIESVKRGFTKAWVVLPQYSADLWPSVLQAIASFSRDFSHTGLRGGGAIDGSSVDAVAESLWRVIKVQ